MRNHRTMRVRGLVALVPLAVLACSQSDKGSDAVYGCEDAYDHLEACIADFCAAGSGDAICEVLTQGQTGTLFGNTTRSCDGMSSEDMSHLATTGCGQLINEAKLHASGKADVPCPSYFPWCNELTPKGADYHVNLLSFENGRADLEVLLPDISRTMELHDGKAYQKLRLTGAGSTRDVGLPAVPVISFLLGLPSGTDTVQVDGFNTVETKTAQNVVLVPSQQSVQEDAPAVQFSIDEAFYAKDVQWPGDAYALDPISTWRNYRVVRVSVKPLQYNPAQKRLDVATRLQLTVRFSDQQTEPKDTVDDGEGSYAQAYGTGMVNYPEAKQSSGQKDDNPDRVRYLVIAVDSLLDVIKPLVDLKNAQGLKTEVVKLSEITTDKSPEKIKERIAAAYTASAIEYVLLVGDVDDLPMYKYAANPEEWGSEPTPSDHWYGLLAGDDLLSEVSVGRITGKTPWEVAVHVSKTVAWESGDVNAAWRKNIALVAHEQDYPRKYTEASESVRTRRWRSGLIEFKKLYGGEKATTPQLLEALNGGLGILAYRGHGSEYAWAEWNGEDFGGANEGVNNGTMTPVVFSIACLNSSLGYDKPSNAEQWVLNSKGGAVAFLGATQPSWTVPNHDFERYLFQAILDDGITAIGPLVNRANASLLAQYGGKNDAADNVKMYLWLGDPSLEVGKVYTPAFETRVGWCNLQWPEKVTVASGSQTDFAYGQVWVNGVTSNVGQGGGVEAQLGWGPAGSDPSKDGWTWAAAGYNGDKGNNDEYMSKMSPTQAGTFAYTFRFKGANDAQWLYCDLDGSQNGVDPAKLGVLTVTETAPPPPDPDAGVDAEPPPPEQDAAAD